MDLSVKANFPFHMDHPPILLSSRVVAISYGLMLPSRSLHIHPQRHLNTHIPTHIYYFMSLFIFEHQLEMLSAS